MKALKITYWVTTSIVALMMTYSAYAYLTQPAMAQGFAHLGFPSYFRIELAIAKVIGAIALLAPLGVKVKEWAYAGFFIVFVSAFIAHSASGESIFYQDNAGYIFSVFSGIVLHLPQAAKSGVKGSVCASWSYRMV